MRNRVCLVVTSLIGILETACSTSTTTNTGGDGGNDRVAGGTSSSASRSSVAGAPASSGGRSSFAAAGSAGVMAGGGQNLGGASNAVPNGGSTQLTNSAAGSGGSTTGPAVTGGAGGASDAGTTGGMAQGGTPASGGATDATATGGVATGGVATGGVASGGVASGGVATGGVATGGVGVAGAAGNASAGSAVSTGGVAGGVGTNSAGGVATGGTTSAVSCADDGKANSVEFIHGVYGCGHRYGAESSPDYWVVFDSGLNYDKKTGFGWFDLTGFFSQSEGSAECEASTVGGVTTWQLPSIAQVRTLTAGCAETSLGGTCRIGDNCLQLACGTDNQCSSCQGQGGPGVENDYSRANVHVLAYTHTTSMCTDCTSREWIYGPTNGNYAAFDPDNLIHVTCFTASVPNF
ncbi:MAG TPA: hypothetical protein VIV60_35545 [Polyangiaceae bacterium]